MDVTYLIANHNYGRWLGDAIDSVFTQNYPKDKLKIVVVNNGCKDESEEVAKEKFGITGKPVTYNHTERKMWVGEKDGIRFWFMEDPDPLGPSAARNVGIKETIANTDAYMILDADDIALPDKTAKFVEAMQKDKVGVVYGNYEIWNVQTDIRTNEYKEPFDALRLGYECIVHSGSLIKKEALQDAVDKYGFYDEEMRTCEDYDLWLRIARKHMIYHVPEILTIVRDTPYNSTRTVPKEVWEKNWARIRGKNVGNNN